MMRTIRAAAVLSLTLAGAAGAQTPSPERVMRQAVAAYEKVRTVRASFEQTLRNPLTGTTVKATGTLVQERPNRLAIRFTDPKGDVIVADGRAVWVYLPSSAPSQVLKLPIGTNAAGALDLSAQFLESPETRYRIGDGGTETIGGKRTRVVTLTPRQPMQFTAAKVWVDASGIIRQLQVTEGSGVERTVRFTSVRLNPKVSRSTFDFTPPKGIKVFDQTRR